MLSLPSPFEQSIWLAIVGAVYIVSRIAAQRKRNPYRLPLPPGPRGLPLVGNIAQIPTVQPWKGYAELFKEYGDMVYLEVLGQPMLVLGSLSRSISLLERRAVAYSGRPSVPILDLLGVTWAFSIMQYGALWRQQRRAFHEHFNRKAVQQYRPIMCEERLNVLRKFRDEPEQFLEHAAMFFGTVIMRATYGFDDYEYNKKLVGDAQVANRAFGEAVIPGKFLVNTFPILKHVPEWFPGAGFRTHFRQISEIYNHVLYYPFEGATRNVINGQRSTYPSLATSLIDRLPKGDSPERSKLEGVARSVCGVAYLAGADTTVTSASAAIFALATHSEAQRKAQAEIDSVVGSDRLPTIEDRVSLPYVHAIVKEVGRWYPAAPLAFAHTNTQDDEYEGYFIPKGTYVMANLWAIGHDPNLFERPFDFVPERHLKDGRIDPSVPYTGAFGFGRRICPGRHFSDDALFLFTASLLSVFNLSPPKDEAGNALPMVLDTDEYFIARPRPYKCDIAVRPERESLLN